MRSFGAIVLIVFVVLALFGVFIFATFTTSTRETIGTVEIWGSLPRDTVDPWLGSVRQGRDDFGAVTYRQFTEEELVPELVAGIASGRGPDLVFFPASSMVKDGDKLSPLSYSYVSRRTFQDSFVQAGEVFLTPNGVAALPLVLDPVVMYWNRTLFGNAALATPPQYWDELATDAPRLSKKSPNGSLTLSAVALGSWGNVAYGKEILITLIHQIGTPVVAAQDDGTYVSVLNYSPQGGVAPAESALRYYVDFADPVKPVYSWNRAQKNSRDAFLAGVLAVYFAPASGLYPIRAANPNLNFDVAPMPVARGGDTGVASRVIGLAVPRGAKNPSGAATAALVMTNAKNSRSLGDALHLPSPRRDVEPSSAGDAYLAVFRASALRAFSFLDPDPVQSNVLFGRMVDDVASGRLQPSEAVRNTHDDLQVLLKVQ